MSRAVTSRVPANRATRSRAVPRILRAANPANKAVRAAISRAPVNRAARPAVSKDQVSRAAERLPETRIRADGSAL